MPFGDLNTVVVTGHYVYPDGTNTPVNAAGTVTFEFPAALGAILDPGSDLIVVPKTLQVVLDGTGHISVVLPATNDPDTAPAFTYKVTENIQQASGNRPRVYFMEVPFGVTSLDLADVTPTEFFPNTYGYVLAVDFNVLEGRVTALEAGGPGTGLVKSVNAKQGVVVLGAADVGADPAGSAASAAAIANAKVAKSGDTMSGPLVLSGDPTSALHPATKQYTDAHAGGFTAHTPVRFASTGNLSDAACVTGQTVDGVVAVLGDRFIKKDQTTQTQNGVFTVANSGAAPRASDADTSAKLDKGALFTVQEGTANGSSSWATNGTLPVIGTDPITFGQASGPTTISPGTGIDVVGNLVSVEPAVLTSITDKAPIDSPTFTNTAGPPTTPVLRVTGLTGATTAVRFVGGSAAKPTTGTFAAGDLVLSPLGTGWICTTGGTFPGTPPVFAEVGAALASFALGLATAYTDQKFVAIPEIVSSNPAIISFTPPTGGQMVMDVSPLEILYPVNGRNTVDQTLAQSSTTMQTITGLVVAVAANTIYRVEVDLWYKASTTANLKLGWVPPSASWAGLWQIVSKDRGVGWAAPALAVANGAGVGIQSALRITGTFSNLTTAGTLTLVGSQNTAEASVVTIGKHSTIVATPIG